MASSRVEWCGWSRHAIYGRVRSVSNGLTLSVVTQNRGVAARDNLEKKIGVTAEIGRGSKLVWNYAGVPWG